MMLCAELYVSLKHTGRNVVFFSGLCGVWVEPESGVVKLKRGLKLVFVRFEVEILMSH